MSDVTDPEVLADLRLRARSARERPIRDYDAIRWQPPKILGQVPCRGRCGAVVDWPEEAEEQFAMFNRELARRDEAPLDKTRIVFCPACVQQGIAARAQENFKLKDYVAQQVRVIRESRNPESEHEAIRKLRKAHHPDIDGLILSVRARIDGKSAANERKPRRDAL